MLDTHFRRRWHRSSTTACRGGMSSLLTRRTDQKERSPSNAWLKDYGHCRQACISELGMGRKVALREHSFHQSVSLENMHSLPNSSSILSSPSVTHPCPPAFNVEHELSHADETQVEGILALRLLQQWHAFGQDDDQTRIEIGGSPGCEALKPSMAQLMSGDSESALTIPSNCQCSKEAFQSEICKESTFCQDASSFHETQLCLGSSILSSPRACDLAMQGEKLTEVSGQMKEFVEDDGLKQLQAEGIGHSKDRRPVLLQHSTARDSEWDWWMHELDSNHLKEVKPSLQECQGDWKETLPSCESRKAKIDVGRVDKEWHVKYFAKDELLQQDDEDDVEESYLIREPWGAETSDSRGFVHSPDGGRTAWLQTDSNTFLESSDCRSGENDEQSSRLNEEDSLEETKEDDIWSEEDIVCSQAKGFPPPISILANESHPGLPSHMPRTIWRSVKKDGRFVLQEVQACPREFFRATRENGCLKLQLVRPDLDADEMLEGELGNLQSEEVEREDNQDKESASQIFENQKAGPRISSDSWISSASEGMNAIADESDKVFECGSSVWSDTQPSKQSSSDSCCPTREATHVTAPNGDETRGDFQHFHASYGLDNNRTMLSPTQSFLPIPYTAMQPAVR